MKKKLIILAMAAAMVVGLTACGSNTGSTTPVSDLSSGTMEIANVEQKGLAGLCDFLKGNGCLGEEYIEMKADIIGAKEGRKYGFTYNDATVIVELYEFDVDNLNETGKATQESLKANGTFQVLGQDVSGVLTENGKYLMVYQDTKADDETNMAQKQKAERFLKEYAENEDSIKVKKKTESETSSQTTSTTSSTSSSDASTASTASTAE